MTVQEYFHPEAPILPIRVGDTVRNPRGDEFCIITWDIQNDRLVTFGVTPGSTTMGMSQRRTTPECVINTMSRYELTPSDITGLYLNGWVRADAPPTPAGPETLPLGSRLVAPFDGEEYILAAYATGYVMVRLTDGCYTGNAKHSYPQVSEATCRELTIMNWEIESLCTK